MTGSSWKAVLASLGILLLVTGTAVFFLGDTGGESIDLPNSSGQEKELAGKDRDGDRAPENLDEVPAGGSTPAPQRPATKPLPGDDHDHDDSSIGDGHIVLRILRADGEEPVANTDFNLRLEGPEKTRSILLRTDVDGVAHIRDLAEGKHPALLRHPLYLADRRILEIPANAESEGPEVVTILLEEGEQLIGKVTDPRGKPIKGAKVTLAAATSDGPQRHQASSDSEGRFILEALTIGAWKISAFHPSYRAAGPMAVKLPSTGELTLRLGDETGVNVSFQGPAGAPCEGAVLISQVLDAPPGSIPVPTTRSGADGLVVLRNLPSDPGARIFLTGKDARYPMIKKTVTVDELESGSFVMRFEPARSIGGTVLDPGGAPVANARISLEGPRKLFLRSTSSGSFQFKKIPPGEYRLQAAAASKGVSRSRVADTEEESLAGLELVLEPGAGSISGRVEDGEGRPLSLVPLRLTAVGFSIESVSSTTGSFSFDELPQASYTLRAGDAKRGQALRRNLGPGSEDVRLVIEKPGSLRGLLKSEGPPRGFSLRLEERPGGEARGIPARTWHFTSQVALFRLRELPPGTYDLLLLRRGEVVGKLERVTIRPGEETGPITISEVE